MKEEDLYEIGNRLYHHESEPPTDGWKKIVGVINTPQRPTAVPWLNQRLWIPLALLLPVTLYFLVPKSGEKDPLTTASVSVDARQEQPALTPTDQSTVRPDERKDTGFRHQASQPEAGSSAKDKLGADKPSNHVHHVQGTPITPSTLKADSEITPPAAERHHYMESTKELVAISEQEQSPDSTVDRAVAKEMEKQVADDVSEGETTNETSQKAWRINFSFTPTYVARSLRPIGDDEVFVTKIKSDDGSLGQRIGLGFAVGAGKPITKDLYVDVHLTFSESKQNTFFSYATGKIDTLLAVQQPDESIRLMPVYAESHREMKSHYSYGGLRIGMTYYFLSKPYGSFNLLAAAGINYLLSADVQERVDGQWIALKNDNLNKFNYTITVGAGYTLDLHKQWALMINPVLSYNIRQAKNDELPYRLNQRPFGLNIMLSRRMGKL
jgi:hypothetical protein